MESWVFVQVWVESQAQAGVELCSEQLLEDWGALKSSVSAHNCEEVPKRQVRESQAFWK